MSKAIQKQFEAWVATVNAQQTLIFREAAKQLIDTMQQRVSEGGNLPDSAEAVRASLVVELGPPSQGRVGAPQPYDPDAAAATVRRAKITDTISATYTSLDAEAEEYGSAGSAGSRFVGLASQQWPAIVGRAAAKVMGSAR